MGRPPTTMASSSPSSNWECGACTHPNKGGKYRIMCATARPKHQAVATAPVPIVAAESACAPVPCKHPSGIILDVVGTAGTNCRQSCEEHDYYGEVMQDNFIVHL